MSQRLAFSYIRFSSERQHLGDSLRRQLALAEDYAARNDMALDTHSYRDMGISAFRGKNALEGKLATFMRAVDGGHVPPDSFLLVESLDRLSRHDVDEALELFLSIIKRGITIVTLADVQQYSSASIKRDHGISLIISITIMMRAHEESAMKSRRNTEAWRERTARGGILTKICPSWLEQANGKWTVIGQKATIVRRVFDLALDGHGALTIQRILNTARVPTLKTAAFWSPGLVTKILKSRSVYGTLERKPSAGPAIEGYYPPIVPRETFDRVRLLVQARSLNAFGPRRVNPSNLFVGMSFCGSCGSRMSVTSGVQSRYLLQCRRSYYAAGCKEAALVSVSIERALFEELLQKQPRNAGADEEHQRAADKVRRIEDELRGIQNSREALIRSALIAPQSEITAQLANAETRLATLRAELVTERRRSTPADLTDVDQARHICAGLAGGRTLPLDVEAMRINLSLLTRRIFARIAFDTVKSEMTLRYEAGRTVVVPFAATPIQNIGRRTSIDNVVRATKTSAQTVAKLKRISRASWLRRFELAIRANEDATVDLEVAKRSGRSIHRDAADLEPEEAAAIYAMEPAPRTVGWPA